MPLVFGYGSLVAGGSRPATLPGWRRTWGVAMDNRVDLPGYKHYEVPGTGERPAVCVAFLDIERDGGAEVPGVVVELDEGGVLALDARERNYLRTDVQTSAGRALAFAGRRAARARRRRASEAGRCVVQRAYLERVRAGFAALSSDGAERFEATTGPLPGPVVDLTLVPHVRARAG
jgi:Gamma-glutamyl cyclotransferase, AIG2-like